MRPIGIGISSFEKIIESGYFFVDKSLFIRDIMTDGSEIIILPRPRRFGKTLNLMMLKSFLEKSDTDKTRFFETLKIWQETAIVEKHFQQYPVVFISFKDVKADNWAQCYDMIMKLIQSLFAEFKHLLGQLDSYNQAEFIRILDGTGTQTDYESSLKFLTTQLFNLTGKRCVVLLDEYDLPIQQAFVKDFFDNMIGFMRNFMSCAFKDNQYLQKGVVTGILRVAKENIFSGLNNPSVYTLLGYFYEDYFGFTEPEVEVALKEYGIHDRLDAIREQFNGYQFGTQCIYNPWSVINALHFRKSNELKCWWINTSSNDLIKELLAKSGPDLKKDLEILIQGGTIEKQIREDIVFADMARDTDMIWSLLLFSGYLKAINSRQDGRKLFYTLKIPNHEVLTLYENIITNWFDQSIDANKYDMLLQSLIKKDLDTFDQLLSEFVSKAFSYFDTGSDTSEKLYHGFVLGLLIGLQKDYHVRSNRESGAGRYDVCLFPIRDGLPGYVIEFKVVNNPENLISVETKPKETLQTASQSAMDQIKTRNYAAELLAQGVNDITLMGIAFEGKFLMIRREYI